MNKDTIAKQYMDGLDNKYQSFDKSYEKEKNKRKGITDEEYYKLIGGVPDIPESLVEILRCTNGTNIPFFQSDVEDGKYPYCLMNIDEIINGCTDAIESLMITDQIKDGEFDERINSDPSKAALVPFAQEINHGKIISRLYIDYSPSKKGKYGQIVRNTFNNKSRYKVIADSFDEYLKNIIDSDYTFIKNGLNYEKYLDRKDYILGIFGLLGRLIMGIIWVLIGIILLQDEELFFRLVFIVLGLLAAFSGIYELFTYNK